MSSSHFTFGTFGPEDPASPPRGGRSKNWEGRVPPVPIGSYAHDYNTFIPRKTLNMASQAK